MAASIVKTMGSPRCGDGRICEYIQKSGNVLTAEPVGMLWSRRALPPGYFGLYMD